GTAEGASAGGRERSLDGPVPPQPLRGTPLGSWLLPDGGCRFLVWAPRADRVAVVLERPGREVPEVVPMEPRARGYHVAVAQGVAAGARYRFRLDDEDDLPDPSSRSQTDGVHGPSAVVDPNAFRWTDGGWSGTPLGQFVIYELHVGTYTAEGTLRSAVSHLDSLAELGVTAIELMPVAQFPGTRNWGYDGAFPYAVQHSYGGAAGLRALVDACHARGLAVVLDVVCNHLGPEGTA